jgi:hypothetical protein
MCGEKELAFLKFAVGLSEQKAAWEDNVQYHPFGMFSHNDFVFLFLQDDKHYLVIPNELSEIYSEVINQEDFSAINEYKNEIFKYARALTNLYGMYEIAHFVAVWNQHHKAKITVREAITELSDRAYFHSEYYFYDEFIVHDCLFDEESVEELLFEVEDVPYYMPTKSVINDYQNEDRMFEDTKIPSHQKMNDFLAEHIAEGVPLENAQDLIAISCNRIEDPMYVRSILEDSDAPLNDTAFCAEFERLYNRLLEDNRIWEFRGFTPYQYKKETGEDVPQYKLPVIPKSKLKNSNKSKNIRRQTGGIRLVFPL